MEETSTVKADKEEDKPVTSIKEYLSKISEIKKINDSLGGLLIYRGESNAENKEVSSGLYRLFEKIKEGRPNADFSDIVDLNNEELSNYFAMGTDQREMNVELQHYAGKSNYIDFSKNSLIALFFACSGHETQEGGVLVIDLERCKSNDLDEKDVVVIKPSAKNNRIIYQSSVLVYTPQGYIEESFLAKKILISKEAKLDILDELKKSIGIDEASIYNDLTGYITRQKDTLTNRLDKLVGEADKASAKLLQEKLPKKPESEKTKAGEYIELAFNYLDKQKFDVAIYFLEKALELEPDSAFVHNSLGFLYQKLGNVKAAEKHLKKALELDSNAVAVHNNLGELYRGQEKYKAAEKHLKRALELDSNAVAVHNNLGKLYLDKNNYEAAGRHLKKALKLEPDNAAVHNSLGMLCIEQEKYKAAGRHLKRALELEPDNVNTHHHLGLLDKKQKKHEAEEKRLTKELDKDPSNAAQHSRLGVVYKKLGKDGAAEEHYKKALELDPSNMVATAAHNNLGVLYGERKEYEKEEKHYKKALELEPDNAVAAVTHNNLGKLYLEQKKYEAAEKHLKIATKLNPTLVNAHFHLATLCAITGNSPGALKHLGEALSLDKKYVLEKIDSTFAWDIYRNDAEFKVLLEEYR